MHIRKIIFWYRFHTFVEFACEKLSFFTISFKEKHVLQSVKRSTQRCSRIFPQRIWSSRSRSMDFKLKGSESVPMEHDESNDTHTNAAVLQIPPLVQRQRRSARTIGAHHFSPHSAISICVLLIDTRWKKNTTVYITDIILWTRNIYNNICNCNSLVYYSLL